MWKWSSFLFIFIFPLPINFINRDFIALDPPNYQDDKRKFINDDDYVSREEQFNLDDQTPSDVPESYIVELQELAKNQMENVMKSENVATTPPSIYDFQGDWRFYSLIHSSKKGGSDYSNFVLTVYSVEM